MSEVIAVIGAQWGDEGKGKLVDALAENSNVVVRAHGGENAGHTVVDSHGRRFGLNLLPAGVLNPDTLNIIASGVAIAPVRLIQEIENLRSNGVEIADLRISEKAQLALPYHKVLDQLYEEARPGEKIGTTGRGIGPTYMDLAQRIGLRAELLRDPQKLLAKIGEVLEIKRRMWGMAKAPDELQLAYYEQLVYEWSRQLGPLVDDTEEVVQRYLVRTDTRVLIEGAHGVLLDPVHGTYPMVTASRCTVADVLSYSGIPTRYLTQSIGVFKAYQTRVGGGAMPTERDDAWANEVRRKGKEHGTTTGRARRIGDFDLVLARYVQSINGFSDIAITKLDVLSDTGDLRMGRMYRVDGQTVDRIVPDDETLRRCEPILADAPGWTEDISGVRKLEDLPAQARLYVDDIMHHLPDAHLRYVGVGESRDALISIN